MKLPKFSKEEQKEMRELSDNFDKSIYGRQSLGIIKSVLLFAIGIGAIAIAYFVESFFDESSGIYCAICLLAVFMCILATIVMTHTSLMMSMFYNKYKK